MIDIRDNDTRHLENGYMFPQPWFSKLAMFGVDVLFDECTYNKNKSNLSYTDVFYLNHNSGHYFLANNLDRSLHSTIWSGNSLDDLEKYLEDIAVDTFIVQVEDQDLTYSKMFS